MQFDSHFNSSTCCKLNINPSQKKTKQLHEIHVYMQKCKTALVVLTVRCFGKNQIKVNKSKYK